MAGLQINKVGFDQQVCSETAECKFVKLETSHHTVILTHSEYYLAKSSRLKGAFSLCGFFKNRNLLPIFLSEITTFR